MGWKLSSEDAIIFMLLNTIFYPYRHFVIEQIFKLDNALKLCKSLSIRYFKKETFKEE